jgi:hypothetical protein
VNGRDRNFVKAGLELTEIYPEAWNLKSTSEHLARPSLGAPQI